MPRLRGFGFARAAWWCSRDAACVPVSFPRIGPRHRRALTCALGRRSRTPAWASWPHTVPSGPRATTVRVAASIEELSFQLTAEALAEQERAVNALRTRPGTVIAAASISGSFLGAKVNHGSLDAWAILALLAFVLCLGCAIWVLLPHELVFAFRGEALLAVSDHEGVEDVTEAYRAAGIWIEPFLDANREKIGSLSTWFTASCAMLAIEVILWTLSVAS